MLYLKRAFKPLAVFLVFLLSIQLISPLVPRTISAVQRFQSRGIEVMRNGEFAISNDNYRDPGVIKAEVQPRPIVDSPHPLGTGLDPNEPQAATDAHRRKAVRSKKGLTREEIKDIKESPTTVSKIKNERTVEFVTKDGLKVVEQSVTERYVKRDGVFEEIDFQPKQDKEGNIINESGKIAVDYGRLSKGITFNTDSSSVTFAPLEALDVKPEISKDGQVVIYKDVWPGVDLVYSYTGSGIKEDIIINDTKAQGTFEFDFGDAVLSQSTEVENGIDVTVGKETLFIDPVFMFTTDAREPLTESVVTQEVSESGTLLVSVDEMWRESLTSEDYPLTIDPGLRIGQRYAQNNYTAHKSDGYSCGSSSGCKINSGRVTSGKYWRTTVKFDIPGGLYGKNIWESQIAFGGAWSWSGGTSDIYAAFAQCNSSINCISGSSPQPSAQISPTQGGNIDTTDLLRWMEENGKLGNRFILWGDESATSWKGHNASNVLLYFAYNEYPNNDAKISYPADNAVIADPALDLFTKPATDPDGDPLTYAFVLTNVNTGTVVQQTGYTSSRTMPVAEGILEDGTTYQWSVYVADTYWQHPDPAFTATFTTDFRLGKDDTQAYDEAGPFAANLATGNAYTGASTHGINALGGSIALGLEYNSPVLSRQGLSARYWNNTTWSGNPVYSRIESNVNHNWSSSSPYPGIVDEDNFSADWNGYFVAPQSGNFKLGIKGDHKTKLYIDGSFVIDALYPNKVWTNSMYFDEGELVPVKVEMKEYTGDAIAKLFIEMPDSTQMIMPAEYLRTAPVTAAYANGLTGKYYFDSGNHNFNTNNKLWLKRNEPMINYNWGSGSPVVGGPEDDFLVRYEGYITVPVTGDYVFRTGSKDGFRLYVGDMQNTLSEDWTDHSYYINYASAKTMTAGVPTKVILEYYATTGNAKIKLWWDGPAGNNIVVENKYLSPDPNVLPVGWDLSVDPYGGIPFEALKVRSNSDVIMITSDGSESLYKYKAVAGTAGSWKPPINEDGWLIKNEDGTYTFTDTVGGVYIYADLDDSGLYKLEESSTPYDDKNPAALIYEYS
ncbi:MAG: PA14 domain-containing protein, partial [Candidatus Dojkabacteria bacterium]